MEDKLQSTAIRHIMHQHGGGMGWRGEVCYRLTVEHAPGYPRLSRKREEEINPAVVVENGRIAQRILAVLRWSRPRWTDWLIRPLGKT